MAKIRRFDDVQTLRSNLLSNTLEAFQSLKPLQNQRYTLNIDNIAIKDPGYTKADEKKAILEKRTLSVPVQGTLKLFDNATGKLVDSQRTVLMGLPHLTDRGTVIYRGNEYTIANQARLQPGVYTRQKDNGDLEAHFNLEGGYAMRMHMDPATGIFYMKVGQANTPIYPILKHMGVDDKQIEKILGPDLTKANRETALKKRTAIQRFYNRLGIKDEGEASRKIRDYFSQYKINPSVVQRTLGIRDTSISPGVLLASARKLLDISKGKVKPDQRDAIQFQKVVSLDDMIKERIMLDAGNIRRNMLWRSTFKNRLAIPNKPMNGYVNSLLLQTGLGQPLTEISPLDLADQQYRITRLGEGGIQSTEAIPEEAQGVQPSYFGFIDPIRGPECYDDKTEVLTDTGWKFWSDIKKSDKFATKQGDTLSFMYPERIIAEYYDGPVYCYESDTINYCVTPNHRLWAKIEGSDEYQFVEADKACKLVREYSGDIGEYPGSGYVDASAYREPGLGELDLEEWFYLLTGHFLGKGIDWPKNVNEIMEARVLHEEFLSYSAFHQDQRLRELLFKVLCEYSEEDATAWVFSEYEDYIMDQIEFIAILLGRIVHRKEDKLIVYKALAKTFKADPFKFKVRRYSGFVYCATVPGGKLFVRRGDSIGHWSGNSEKLGVDMRTTYDLEKGPDGKFYRVLKDAKTGKMVRLTNEDIPNVVIAFPGEMKSGKPLVPALKNGEIDYVKRSEVTHELPSTHSMWNLSSLLAPMLNGVKGGRILMAGKFFNQALPLVNPEVPLVQSAGPDGRPMHEFAGDKGFTIRSDVSGRVSKVTDDYVVVDTPQGKKKVDIYNNLPFNYRTFVHSTPVVQPGDRISKGQLLAKSNFTDDKGRLAFGVNLKSVDADTMVLWRDKERGIKLSRIADIDNPLDSATYDQERKRMIMHRVKRVIAHEVTTDMLEIRTSTGRTLKVSDNHSMLRMTDAGLVPVNAEHLRPGISYIPRVCNLEWIKNLMASIGDADELGWGMGCLIGIFVSCGRKLSDNMLFFETDQEKTIDMIRVNIKAIFPDLAEVEILDNGVLVRSDIVIRDMIEVGFDNEDMTQMSDKCLNETFEFLEGITTGLLYTGSDVDGSYLLIKKIERAQELVGIILQVLGIDYYIREDRIAIPYYMWERLPWLLDKDMPKRILGECSTYVYIPTELRDKFMKREYLPYVTAKQLDKANELNYTLVFDMVSSIQFLDPKQYKNQQIYDVEMGAKNHTFLCGDMMLVHNTAYMPFEGSVTGETNTLWYEDGQPRFCSFSAIWGDPDKAVAMFDDKSVVHEISRMFWHEAEQIYDVITSSGRHVGLTPCHSLVCLNDDYTYSTMPTERAIKEHVKIPRLNKVDLPVTTVTAIIGDSAYKLDYDLGLLLGLYTVYGSWFTDMVSIPIYEGDLFNCVRDVAKELFTDVRTISNRIEICNQELVDWLHDNIGHDYMKNVPDFTFGAPEEFRKGFLHGCLSEAYMVSEYIDLVIHSRKARDGICLLLASFGVATKHFDHKEGFSTLHGLKICVNDIKSSALKNFERCEAWNLDEVQCRESFSNTLPVTSVVKQKLKERFPDYPVSDVITRGAILELINEDETDPVLKRLRKLALSNISFDIVLGGELKEYNGTVYDFDMTPTSNFMCVDTLIVHNSNYEDAVVITDRAAKKLAAEIMVTPTLKLGEKVHVGREGFRALYPGRFKEEDLKDIDDNGIIKPGSIVKPDQPLILAYEEKEAPKIGALFKGKKSLTKDSSVVWDRDTEGVVTDVAKTKDGILISVKTNTPVKVGSKITGRAGDKGVVSRIISVDEAPKTADGEPVDIILAPFGIPSRGNPAQVYEALLGKIARKTGEPYVLPVDMPNLRDFVVNELKKHGMTDTEALMNAKTGKPYEDDIITGDRYFMAPYFKAEEKLRARETGRYTVDRLPARGGKEGAKRISLMEINALLSHGATDFLRDSKLMRGQSNEKLWQAMKLGYAMPSPEAPFIYRKFLSYLVGSGVNVKKTNKQIDIMALTDKDIEALAKRPIQNSATVDPETLKPIEGGMFDPTITGGHGGLNWSYVPLNEPMPNPVMEEPIRRMLGLTKKEFLEVLAGKKELNKETGPKAIQKTLGAIDLDKAIKEQQRILESGSVSKRDNARKLLGYYKMSQRTGIHPRDFMLTKFPVLPPIFRPIAKMDDVRIVTDPNYLYKSVFDLNKTIKDMRKEKLDVGEHVQDLYKTLVATAGLGDPIQPQLKNSRVQGLLAHIFGANTSPKYGMFQRKVLGIPVDLSARATITPDSSLAMDEVALPKKTAWKIFEPFVMRHLVRSGMKPSEAVNKIKDEAPIAQRALDRVMQERPVVVNRAPTLHKFGIMGAWARLSSDDTLHISPVVTKSFGADFDGDEENFHVPVSKEAVNEVIDKMMPSRSLFSPRDNRLVYTPTQEFAFGLWKSRNIKKGKPLRFKSEEDAIKAYRQGLIRIDTPIVIMP